MIPNGFLNTQFKKPPKKLGRSPCLRFSISKITESHRKKTPVELTKNKQVRINFDLCYTIVTADASIENQAPKIEEVKARSHDQGNRCSIRGDFGLYGTA